MSFIYFKSLVKVRIDFITILNYRFSSSNNFSCLSNSKIRPPDYRLEDANTLEQELKKNMGGNLSITDKSDEEATSSN